MPKTRHLTEAEKSIVLGEAAIDWPAYLGCCPDLWTSEVLALNAAIPGVLIPWAYTVDGMAQWLDSMVVYEDS